MQHQKDLHFEFSLTELSVSAFKTIAIKVSCYRVHVRTVLARTHSAYPGVQHRYTPLNFTTPTIEIDINENLGSTQLMSVHQI